MYMLFMILGGAGAIYYIILITHAGSVPFSLFWLISSLLCVVIGVYLNIRHNVEIFKKVLFLQVFCVTTLILAVLLFCATEALILSGVTAKPDKECNVLLVLGSRLREGEMTETLKLRLDAAYDYAEEHPETIVIVTGGKADDEKSAEAVVMRQYLVEKGLDSDRIKVERYAENTYQNIRYGYSMVTDKNNTCVGIVTSGFHVYRAVKIAEHYGAENVCGLAAPSDPVLLPNDLVREFFAVVKEKLEGHI